MKKIFTALVLICLVALPLLAQTRGGWEIVRADFGSGANWVDVTSRVRSLVRGEALNFRVDGNILGAESRPGCNRVLRLQLRDSQGKTRQMKYRDGQQVGLRVYSAYQGGLHINRAFYGIGNHSLDVTSRLNSWIQGQQLEVKVNNQNMGGDPAPGQDKTLTVQYSLNGRSGQVAVEEGGTLRLSDSNSGEFYGNMSQGRLQINRAIYGSGYRTSDVTSRLNSQVQGDQLNLQVNNNTMGGDPAPGQDKTLSVQYSLNGRSGQVAVKEGGTLRLSDSNSGEFYGNMSQGRLQINRAIYGSGYRTSDVTSRLNSQVQGDQLNLQVNNNTMGGDPAPGQDKTLTVQYSLNGRSGQVAVKEGGTLRLSDGTTSDFSTRIRCESLPSNNYGRSYCAADTRNGVSLVRQIGESACTQGSSWGYDNRGVWVANGCRGEFEMRGNTRYTGATTTIPNGKEVSVRTNEPIDSRNATSGQQFSAEIANDVLDSAGRIAIPRGSDAVLVIRGSNSSDSDLVLDVDSIVVAGTRYEVSTGDMEKQTRDGVGANQRTAIFVGGGAALGTVIGAIVGGGKGAAIGAAMGAGAGLGTQVLTKGSQVRVPAETVLRFRLDQDLLLRPVGPGYRGSSASQFNK